MSNDPSNTPVNDAVTDPPAPDENRDATLDATPTPVVLPETAEFGSAPALTVPTVPPLVSKAIEAAVAKRGTVLTFKAESEAAAKVFENLLKRAATWSETKIRAKTQADGLTVHFTHPDPKAPVKAE